MYTKYENLRKLDTVIITEPEFDSVLMWSRLNKGKLENLKRLKVKEPKKPPALDLEDGVGAK